MIKYFQAFLAFDCDHRNMVSLIFMIASLQLSLSRYLEQRLDSKMTMGWDIDEVAGEIQIRLKCKISKGYCSVGLRYTMTDCDMFAALTNGKTVTLQDYWSRDHSTPKTDAKEGGQNNLVYISGGLDEDDNIDITFKRKLVTNDEYDQDIYPDIHAQITWAYLDDKLGWKEHSEYDSANFVWATKESETFFEKKSDEIENHGRVMSVAWGLFASIGIISARYFKQHCAWFYIHLLSMLFASITTIATSIGTFEHDKYSYEVLTVETYDHSRIGMALASLVVSQCVFGFLSVYHIKYSQNTQSLIMINRMHKLVGYSMFIIGLNNCVRGWILFETIGQVLMVIGIIVIIIVFIVLESIQVCCLSRIRKANQKLKTMNHFEAFDLIRKGKKIMFYDDLVLDVKWFSGNHPGGSFLIEKAIGEDTGKYMTGCSSYGNEMNPYDHSAKAFSMLRGLAIARILEPAGYLEKSHQDDQGFYNFYLSHKEQLNNHTYLFYFKSDSTSMASSCLSATWLGKHFLIITRKHLKYTRRYYSSLFVNLNEWAGELGLSTKSEEYKSDGAIKFIVKIYQNGKMTSFLDKLNTGMDLRIKGPLGPGLMLNDLEGNFVAIAGGTGLVPFLDLVHMAQKKVDRNSKEFKLDLFVFFKTWKDGFGLEILEAVQKSVSWLTLQIITDENPKKSESKSIIQSTLQSPKDLIWICGPSGFNRTYHSLSLSCNQDPLKIILM